MWEQRAKNLRKIILWTKAETRTILDGQPQTWNREPKFIDSQLRLNVVAFWPKNRETNKRKSTQKKPNWDKIISITNQVVIGTDWIEF